MKTNELEKEIGLSKYTIRYYEKEGLIQPKREENGYRDYDDETVQILKIIKFLRNLQISVDDLLVDSLDYSFSTSGSDLHRLLLDCNQTEQEIIIRMVKELKATLACLGI